ncbi:hypothetical protein EMIHUDRAFT_216504 [Emiliania huxleyi CCMP1516]|uniref:U-box domain-containing protein n=2 Tax=Emiliania huxleyi TaxID=2903 RepID=A0A0D3IF26_EMIH1|nr:hypothetical protein EMIHUDRAFT_216504 [Emiliania huxleyi CCMP1516]EOD09861.1 hypothetical protein EMIHUDRAFT_216504 [Emiliania huxleyi CCMP1516]|eukprot:XP_005762290.1 hypothetical protein EMIHUDRAFT_216504 [Emiliania huxleyi CCMP1516]
MSLSVEMAHLNPYAHLLMNIAGFGHKRSLPWIAEGAAFSAAEDAGGAQCVAGTAQGASEDVRDAIQREEALQQGAAANGVSQSHVRVGELMEDPVINAAGQTYERAAIEKWIAKGKRTDPKSGTMLEHTHLLPNVAVRSMNCSVCLPAV